MSGVLLRLAESIVVEGGGSAIEGQIVGHPAMSRSVERAVRNVVAKQYGRGALGCARVDTARRVALHALRALQDLEREEAAALVRDPISGGVRQRMIVDTATLAMDEAVRATSRDGMY